MSSPDYGLMEAIKQASNPIGNGGETDAYSCTPTTIEGFDGGQTYFLGFTNIYMVPDRTNPRLSRLDVKNPDLNEDVVDSYFENATQLIRDNTSPGYPNQYLQHTVEFLTKACEIVEEDLPGLVKLPFITLGLLTVYATESSSYGELFTYKPLRDAMYEASGKIDPVRDVSEESYQDMYALESEHAPGISYEAWRQRIDDVYQELDDGTETPEERAGAVAVGAMARLVIPEKHVHPVFKAGLFDE